MGVVIGDEEHTVQPATAGTPSAVFHPIKVQLPDVPSGNETVSVPLSRLCLARSGDKGDTSNVGVIARSPAIYAWMLKSLTAEFVKERFEGVCGGSVERFEVSNLLAINFLLHESLGGGGTMSLLVDAQGKTYAQFLLATTVDVDAALVPETV
jgi:hypothetical protein